MRLALIFFVSLLIFTGCSEKIKYVCFDGSVVTEPSECPQAIEEKKPITPPEVVQTDTFTLKRDQSIEVYGKKLVLKNIFADGKTVIEVSGITRDIKTTRYMEVINGLEITVQGISFNVTNLDESSAILKVNPLQLENNEYLFFIDQPQIVEGKEVTLSGVTSSYVIVNTPDVLGIKLYSSSSKIFDGLNVTNVKAFPRGLRIEDYAILRVVGA